MKSKTYEEWREIGYQVMKGQKASGRNKDGKATFTREQVEERELIDPRDSYVDLDYWGDND
jgi:hypothetical protein